MADPGWGEKVGIKGGAPEEFSNHAFGLPETLYIRIYPIIDRIG